MSGPRRSPTVRDAGRRSADAAALDARIWDVVAGVPAGRVATYGQIGRGAGLVRGARRVGQALRRLQGTSSVPWHRVINAQGRISLPDDSSSHAEQLRRLRAEGVLILRGRVDLGEYGWLPNLDKAIWSEE